MLGKDFAAEHSITKISTRPVFKPYCQEQEHVFQLQQPEQRTRDATEDKSCESTT